MVINDAQFVVTTRLAVRSMRAEANWWEWRDHGTNNRVTGVAFAAAALTAHEKLSGTTA